MKEKDIVCVVKAAALALALSLLFAIVFAVILRTVGWGENVVYPVNQILKLIATMVGAFAFIRGEKGWLKGGISGLVFSAFSYLAFSAIGGDFSLSWLIVLELAITFLAGALSGALAVNLH